MRNRAERSDVWNHVVVDHILFGNSSDLQNVILTWYHEPKVKVSVKVSFFMTYIYLIF